MGEELRPEQLCVVCDPAELEYATTDEVPDLEGILGQPRAVEAVRFGTGIRRDGYNIFAFGAEGTGRHTLVRRALEERAQGMPVPPDLCYVHDFENPNAPKLLKLPAGTGARLRRDMHDFVEELRPALQSAFESDEYHARREALDEELKERPEKQISEIADRAREQGVAILRTPGGLAFAPLKDGEIVPAEDAEKIPEEEREQLKSRVEALQEEVQKALRQAPRWAREHGERLRALDREFTDLAVGHLMDEIRASYAGDEPVSAYLDAVQRDLSGQAPRLLQSGQSSPLRAMLTGSADVEPDEAASLARYEVNLLVDNSRLRGAPVVHEDNPNHDNLSGRIEHLAKLGALVTDFRLIRAGALHRAHGGFLLLDAHKLLRAPYAWEALKRALESRQLKIEPLGQSLGIVSTSTLEPEPLDLDVQVVLVGEPLIYYLLEAHDRDFEQLFKVAADFDGAMEATPETRASYVRVVATLVRREALRPFDRGAIARVIDRSHRMAADRRKLSARLGAVSDLLREADYFAGEDGSAIVTAAHVRTAVAAQVRRADRMRERVQEGIERGVVLIDTAGSAIGQVNGLSVISLGDFAFGRPSRITARARSGPGKVVDIEREVELGGASHSKGVLILAGYLGERYAPDTPLSLSASLVFEQSYGGVDGDSASLGELVALLSAIARVPVRQAIAVTGSVNQHGEVQAIGGVNEKIEGFFDVCAARGLDGSHGVVVPAANAEHLVLREDVVEAVRDGRFHVWTVGHVDEAIERMTGMEAGERDADGAFPEGGFNRRVEDRLRTLAERLKSFTQPDRGP